MSKKEKFYIFLIILCSINICYCLVCIGFFDKDLVSIGKHLILAIINCFAASILTRAI